RESGTILSLFKIFKREKASICVVIDEFGGCLGIVTMHDILEQIVGKVEDPHNINQGSDRGIIYRQDQKLFILDGTADLEELRKMIKSIIGEEKNVMNCKNETINGYIINRLKRIPEQGEIFELEGLKYRIMKAKKNFVETIIIQL
ncbi:MAG: transporter associated domain-containing protein, partial [Candidatus Delongbacteria bacterium]